jgi:hypothetical protein
MSVTYGNYKGNDTITLRKAGAKETDRGFTFGRTKAKLAKRDRPDVSAFAKGQAVEETELIKLGEYKGCPTITLLAKAGDNRGWTFGQTKAQLLDENFDDVEEFADSEPSTDAETIATDAETIAAAA